MAANITVKIIALLKQAGIDYSKMAGKVDHNKISQLITKTQKTATKPKLIDALNKEKATYKQALDVFENDAKYLSQMNKMEQVNFVNNLEDYFKVGGPIKYTPSNVVTQEGTPVVGKKLETLAARKGIKDKPDATSLQGAMEGLMSLVDEMKGISPKMRKSMDRDELVEFLRKMRGRDFTNQEIRLVRDYMDNWGIGLAKEKAAPAMVHAKKLGAKNKEEFKFVEEYLDNIQTTSPEKFRETYGSVKNVNMELSDIFDKKLEKHFKKKYKWDKTKKDGGLDEATFEKYDDELYEAQKEFGDFHRIYDTDVQPGSFGFRKSTSWVNHPNNWLDEASEKMQSITGEGLNVDFYKNYTDEVLTKYPKPEKFQYGGIAGMLGEPTYQDEEHRVPYKDGEFGKKEDLPSGLKAEVGDPTPGWGLSDLVSRYFLYQKVLPGVGEETRKYLGEKFLNDLNAQGYSPKDFKAYIDEQFPEPTYADGGRTGFKKGFSAGRRKFLQGVGALAALPFIGKYFKWAKPLAKSSKVLTQVPIKNIDGMPAWFKPLVNKVIAQGDDVSKRFATGERQIVHQSTLPDSKTPVTVTQDLDTGDVLVDVGMGKHGFPDGHLGQPVRLEYKAAEDIMSGPRDEPFKVGERDPLLRIKSSVHEDLVGSGLKGDPKTLRLKPGKTKEEFWVEEAEFSGGHPENVKFEESTFEKFGEHGSNFDEVEKFATGKVKKVKTKQGTVGYSGTKYRYEGDMASGGRVPLKGGKLAFLQGIGKIMDEFFPGTTKIGQRSKPFPGKVQEKMDLRKAITDFKEREKAAKLKIWEDSDKVRAAVDDIFPTGDYKYDAQMAAESLVENNPKFFNNKLYDDLDDKTRMKIYGAVVNVVQKDLAKMIQLKRASKPTKTLKGIEETGTINISDPDVAEEFARFMKETDPKGHKKLEQTVDLLNLDTKGKKGHAEGGRVSLSSGGLAGMLGE